MARELDEVKISVHELELGMYVTNLDKPWEETSYPMQGILIADPDDIDALQNECKYVYIERKLHLKNTAKTPEVPNDRRKKKRGLFARSSKPGKSTKSSSTSTTKIAAVHRTKTEKVTYINQLEMESEFSQAKECYKYAKLTAQSIMDGFRIGRSIDINACRDTVNDVVESIIRNPNALMWLSKMKNKDDYTAEHCLNVCILSVSFARHLGHSQQEIEAIGLAGLLHDVGKAKIPLEILNKPGRFTNEEFALMKQHTTFGRDLLMSLSESDHFAIDVAYCHHERIDEAGYPRRLQRHQIPYYARLIAITDTYDAITSSRCYDNGRSSMDALDIIYKNKGRQFDEELAVEFIKCIGIYPPGSVIEMTNGEVGIIISNNKDNKLKPRILIVLEADKKTQHEKVIDLRDLPTDDHKQTYRIGNELPNGKYGVDIKNYLKKGLRLER